MSLLLSLNLGTLRPQRTTVSVEEKVRWPLTGNAFINSKKKGRKSDHLPTCPQLSGLEPTVTGSAALLSYWNLTFQEISPRACLLGFNKSCIIE